MILIMKKNSIDQKNYIEMFTTSILMCMKYIYIYIYMFAKNIHLLSSTWTLFFKQPQILGPIQVFASNVKKHDYNNLIFEVNANKT